MRLNWLDAGFADDCARGAYLRGECPKEGFYRVSIPRRIRKGYLRDFLPARIYRPIPIDPDTGEILDRWPPLEGEINGTDVHINTVWAYGEPITEDEYKWLKAIVPIRYP